jgi:hypothetical protein
MAHWRRRQAGRGLAASDRPQHPKPQPAQVIRFRSKRSKGDAVAVDEGRVEPMCADNQLNAPPLPGAELNHFGNPGTTRLTRECFAPIG